MELKISRADATAGFGYGVDVFNKYARSYKGLTDDFIKQALGMKIDERVDFNDINYEFMKKFMSINIFEHEVTKSILGNDAHLFGDSTAITGMAQRPSYANGVNYVTNFASSAGDKEKCGINSTREIISSDSTNPYDEVRNLYPDDLDTGHGKNFHKWSLDGNESILTKTKELFRKRKINTIISRFGTSTDDGGTSVRSNGDVVTGKYGMSHGRNLLKKGAEDNGEKYDINGYNNPYCRVWTHHYQYDRLNKLIRPFVGDKSESGLTDYIDTDSLHHWKGFEQEEVWENVTTLNEKGEKITNSVKKQPAGWKSEYYTDDGENYIWKGSVLRSNGFVNITPKYLGGGDKNIHTKDCMFSIENLAWRGYDPYSFEQALSWEQRGPLGGRIMWFPPYGLTFNETTQANWSSNTFIGRGEDVYTYVNTVRSGTLSFIMLTDHPSIVDYANWYDKESDNDLKDTDLLRFFAGCDKSAILNAVKPTPLTDEYTQKITENEIVSDLKPNQPIVKEPEIPDSEKTIQFYVFYPNNYSGCYDMPNPKVVSPVHAIGYLLFGNGCNKKYDENDFGTDLAISFDLMGRVDTGAIGDGYEMVGNNGISVNEEDNYIVGSAKKWEKYALGDKYITDTNSIYIKETGERVPRRWYYRIDGEYKVPSEGNREKNTYDQILSTNANYYDSKGFGLNISASAVKNSGFVNEEVNNLYSLAEVAAAIAKGGNGDTYKFESTYNELTRRLGDTKRVNELCDILFDKKMSLSEIRVSGYSNSHGNNASQDVNAARNENLSTWRARTVKNWLIETYEYAKEDIFKPGANEASVKVKEKDKKNVNGLSAKIYRSAKVEMVFKTNKTEKLSEAISEGELQRWTGFSDTGEKDKNGRKLYKDNKTGEKWYEDGEQLKKLNRAEKISDVRGSADIRNHEEENYRDYRGRMMFMYLSDKADNQTNKLRYDQEYHFYKELEAHNPIVFEKLTDKLKFFDPAFHSMTPEGFTERLTFLNQCTRQGNTVTSSDINGKTASNLGFGRPPFCVLRIGDFYYQTIVIDSVNIDYNVSGGLQWDLNPEGAGVQPMLAQVNISFKFIGGGDLGGPIRRLQNAMTFNYYANSRLFDNRADRTTYNSDPKTMGAKNHDIDSHDSYAYTTQMAK